MEDFYESILSRLAEETKDFSGSEIASVVTSTLIQNIGEETINLESFFKEIEKITPLAVSKKKQLDDLRKNNNFILANTREKAQKQSSRTFKRKVK